MALAGPVTPQDSINLRKGSMEPPIKLIINNGMSRLPFNMGRDSHSREHHSREHHKVDLSRTGSLRSVLQEASNTYGNFDGNAMADRVKSLGAENHELRMALQDARVQLKAKSEECKRLADELERSKFEAREQSQSNLQQMQSLKDAIESLGKEKSRLVEEYARGQLNIAESNKAKAEMEVKLVRTQEQVKQYEYLEKALTTLKKDNQQLSVEVDRLRNQLKVSVVPSRERSSSKGKHQQQYPKQDEEPVQRSHNRQRSEQIKADLQEIVEKLQMTNQSQQHEIFISREKVEWLEQDKRDLEGRHQQAIASLNSTVQFYRRQLQEAMLELQSESTKLGYLERKHEEVKEKAYSADLMSKELAEQRKHSEVLRQNLNHLQVKIGMLQQAHVEQQKTSQNLSEVSKVYSQLLHKHEQLQLENRQWQEQLKQLTEQHRTRVQALLKSKGEEWKKSSDEIACLKASNQKLEQEAGVLREVTNQLRTENKTIKDSVSQIRVQNELLQQKLDTGGQAQFQLARLRDDVKNSQSETIRVKGQLLEASREVLRLKDQLKFSSQKHMVEREKLIHQLTAQNQSTNEAINRQREALRQCYEKQRQSYEAQMFVKLKSLESDMQSAQQAYHLKLERLQKEQAEAVTTDRLRERRSSNTSTVHTEELLNVIGKLEQKVNEQQDAIFQYTQKLLEKDTLLASRAVENDQKKDILLLLDKLKEEELHNERLTQRLLQLQQHLDQKDSVLVHVRETAQQSRDGHEDTIAAYDRMVKQLQQQLEQTCSEVVLLKRQVDRLQAENSTIQSLSIRNQRIIDNIDTEFSTAQKQLHDHKKNELLLTEHLNKAQDERKRRLGLFGKLTNRELVSKHGNCEELLIESLVSYCNTLEAKHQGLEPLKKLNTQLQESVELSTKELDLLRQKLSQLEAQSKSDRNLIIKMEDDHNRQTLERARIYQQQYDSLLVKYEKYKGIARREKSRKDAQKAIIRESNEFNEVIVQKCKALIR